jgi:GTP-binding protein
VLLESMRREGMEVAVGKPKVILKEIAGKTSEPIEFLVVEVPSEHSISVMRLVLERQGECVKMENHGASTHIEFYIPARALIGLRTRMMTGTQGTAIMHHNFHEYRPLKANVPGRPLGVFISKETEAVTAYAIEDLQQRGSLFVAPQDMVYGGQVVGEHVRDNDLTVNVTRKKPLTNMRASGSDDKATLKPPREFSLEAALEYIEDDELVEITPKAIRMRKVYLSESERKKYDRQNRD